MNRRFSPVGSVTVVQPRRTPCRRGSSANFPWTSLPALPDRSAAWVRKSFVHYLRMLKYWTRLSAFRRESYVYFSERSTVMPGQLSPLTLMRCFSGLIRQGAEGLAQICRIIYITLPFRAQRAITGHPTKSSTDDQTATVGIMFVIRTSDFNSS
jgi:hypothetical protein